MPAEQLDLSAAMGQRNEQLLKKLEEAGIAGCVLKARSPSCAVGTARVYDRSGLLVATNGHGTLTRVLRRARPRMPLIDEEQLQQPGAIARFVRQIHAYQRRLQPRSGGRRVGRSAMHRPGS